MAVTVAHVKSNVAGSFFEHLVDITGPASYTTGGELLTAAQIPQLLPRLGNVGLADLAKVQLFLSETNPSGTKVALDKTNSKILYFAAGAEAGAASNQSAVPVRVLIRYGNVGD